MLTGHGGPEVLRVEERPDPEIGRGQVRIAVRAAGINFADTLARVGLYPDAPKPPCVLGYEVAGEVESVGDGVTDFKPGDRVDGRHPLRRPGLDGLRRRRRRCCRCPSGSASSRERHSRSTTRRPTAALVVMGGLEAGRAGADPRGRRRRRHLGDSGCARHRRGDLRHRLALEARCDPQLRASSTRSTTAPRTSRQEVDADHRWRGARPRDSTRMAPRSFRKDYRLLRPGGRLVMYGLSEASSEKGRSIPRADQQLSRGCRLATMPVVEEPRR